MGSMNKAFKFPPTPGPGESIAVSNKPSPPSPPESEAVNGEQEEESHGGKRRSAVINPSNIEVPAPPPMEKEKTMSQVSLADSAEDDVGDTVEISLN